MNNYYSYSKLSTYLNCPQKYKLSYLDKIKKKEESIEAFIGKVIHEVLEWLYNNSKEELSYISFDSIMNKYNEIWNKRKHDKIFLAWIKIQYKRNKKLYNLEWFKSNGIEYLREYYKNHGPDFSKNNVIGVEEKIVFDLGAFKFKGYIDRIDKIDNYIIINDYKTGKTKTKSELLKDLQVKVYILAVLSKYKDYNIKLRWHYLNKKYNIVEIDTLKDLKPTFAENIKNNILKIINDIIDSEKRMNFPSKESNLCEWCYMWNECSTRVGNNPSINL